MLVRLGNKYHLMFYMRVLCAARNGLSLYRMDPKCPFETKEKKRNLLNRISIQLFNVTHFANRRNLQYTDHYMK